MNRRQLLAVALVALVLPAGHAAGVVTGEPHLTVHLPHNTVVPGEERTLTITVANDAELGQASLTQPALNDRVTTARGLEVTLEAGSAPISVETGTQVVGSLSDGGSAPLGFRVSVDDEAAPGTYRLPVELRYTYTRQISEEGGAASQDTTTRRLFVRLRIDDAARFRVVGWTSDVRAGDAGTVSVTLENAGTAVANATTVSLAAPSGAFALDGAQQASRYVGTWSPGERRTLTYAVRAADDVTVLRYPFTVQATYRNATGEPVTSDSLVVGVAPTVRPRFPVVAVRSDAVVDGSGTARIDLRNAGTDAVRDAVVTVESPAESITVDGGSATRRFVGSWAPGEVRTVMVDLTTAPTATAGAYALSTSVSYTQGTAVARTRTVPAGIAVASTLPFEVRDLTSSLHVGEPGSISGTIVNTGDRTARGTVVSLETASPHVLVTDGGVGVGDLAPGESAAFDIDLVVAPSARSGARSFSIAVAYETPDGGHLAGEVASLQREVGPDRELFALEASNATFPPDSTNRLTVQVTNRGELAQEEIVLRLAPGEPFTSVAPEAYLPRLEPGASATVAFELSVDEDAVASTHAATVNVTAEATGSDDRATDTYRIQLAVVEPTTAVDPVSIVSLLVLGLAIVAGVGWWWRRRR